MLVSIKSRVRGDTLIEVLFATAVFSLVAVGALSIMNQGTATSQRALEITLVRQEIDAQAETLRFLNASYVSSYSGTTSYSGPADQWLKIQDSAVATVSQFGGNDKCPSPPAGSFILNTHNATFITSPSPLSPSKTFSQVIYDYDAGDDTYAFSVAEGLWIEAIRSVTSSDQNQAKVGYIDFHIRACWDSPGQSIPVTIGTIVRLYEPRG